MHQSPSTVSSSTSRLIAPSVSRYLVRVRLRVKVWVRVRGPSPGPKPHPKPSLLKVADFGLARSLVALKKSDEGASVLTDYVATRWSRARAP